MSLPPKLVSPFVMWAKVLAGFILAFLLVPDTALFQANIFTSALFLLAGANWLYFFAFALVENRYAARSAASVKSLVTTGVYTKVRHPIYSADIFFAWGIFLFSPTLRIFACAAWLTVVLLLWMRLEENALLKKFGAQYARYCAKTPMLIPNYFKK